MVLITASCTMLWTSIHSLQALCLLDLIPWTYFSLLLCNFPIFFNLILNLQKGAHDLSHSQFSVLFLLTKTPSLAARNIINLILVLTIWWCPCIVFSCVVGRGCLVWPVYSLGKNLLAFALLHFLLQSQTCLLLQVSLDLLLLHSSLLWWKGHPF